MKILKQQEYRRRNRTRKKYKMVKEKVNNQKARKRKMNKEAISNLCSSYKHRHYHVHPPILHITLSFFL